MLNNPIDHLRIRNNEVNSIFHVNLPEAPDENQQHQEPIFIAEWYCTVVEVMGHMVCCFFFQTHKFSKEPSIFTDCFYYFLERISAEW